MSGNKRPRQRGFHFNSKDISSPGYAASPPLHCSSTQSRLPGQATRQKLEISNHPCSQVPLLVIPIKLGYNRIGLINDPAILRRHKPVKVRIIYYHKSIQSLIHNLMLNLRTFFLHSFGGTLELRGEYQLQTCFCSEVHIIFQIIGSI